MISIKLNDGRVGTNVGPHWSLHCITYGASREVYYIGERPRLTNITSTSPTSIPPRAHAGYYTHSPTSPCAVQWPLRPAVFSTFTMRRLRRCPLACVLKMCVLCASRKLGSLSFPYQIPPRGCPRRGFVSPLLVLSNYNYNYNYLRPTPAPRASSALLLKLVLAERLSL